jgi:hypothetical protein
MAENLSPSSADVTESGNLTLPETSGPHRLVMGMLYLFIWFSEIVRVVTTEKFSRFVLCMRSVFIGASGKGKRIPV